MNTQKRALVSGAGGFIGGHLVKKLKREGYWVRATDSHYPRHSVTVADEFVVGNLTDPKVCDVVLDDTIDEVYQLAADMGGMGFIDSAEVSIMINSALINLNMIRTAIKKKVGRYFFSSSAYLYPNQELGAGFISEEAAYPPNPDNEYGWEKLFSERTALAVARNTDLEVRIARFQNCFGPETTWKGGREKAPAALCRKIAMLPSQGGEIEVWGSGTAERNFIFVDDLCDAVHVLMQSDCEEPTNIGTTEVINVNALVDIIAEVSGKSVTRKHIDGPVGVLGRYNSVDKIASLGWVPKYDIKTGMEITYKWIEEQVKQDEVWINLHGR